MNPLLRVFVISLLLALSSAVALGQASFDSSDSLVSLAAGTGFVVHSDGYILTNEHVIRDATSISVFLNDAQVEYAGTVVATDAANDLALIKIDTTRLPAVTLGDSDSVLLFDPIVSMGYPASLDLGTDLTTSTGQVTAVRTNMPGREGMETFQTDGAIYHGSSGGPLLNMKGEVIGVNYSGIEGSEFYFAIPIRDASQVLSPIPGFDTWQASGSSAGFSAEEVVNRVRPSIAYIRVEIARPLTDLLPKEALDSALDTWATYTQVDTWDSGIISAVWEITPDARCGPPPPPLGFGLALGGESRGALPDYWTPFCNVYELLEENRLEVESAAERSSTSQLGDLKRTVSFIVFDLGSDSGADAGHRVLSASITDLIRPGEAEEHVIISDSRPLGDERLDFSVRWTFGAGINCAGSRCLGSLGSGIYGFGVYSVGRFLFTAWMSESDVALTESEKTLYGADEGLRDGHATGKGTPDFQTQYKYTSIWSVGGFIDAFNELLDTAIGALSD